MRRQSVVLMWAVAVSAAASAGWFGYQRLAARRVSQETDRLAEILALRPTSRVADVGAGDGAFSVELASRVVPQGHVFATEIEEDSAAGIRSEARTAGLENVTVIRAAEASTNLPNACCDAVFLRGVYHHITNPVETNHSLRGALRPHGRLAVIDFEPSWFLSRFFPVRGVPASRGGHGVPPAIVVSEMQKAGFELIDQLDEWPGSRYCLVFRKLESEPAGLRSRSSISAPGSRRPDLDRESATASIGSHARFESRAAP
jgi:ubiquinone/menaquinone biosynthesis C-methylase UbiE